LALGRQPPVSPAPPGQRRPGNLPGVVGLLRQPPRRLDARTSPVKSGIALNFSGFTRTIRPARNSERGTRSCSSVPHSEFRVPRWEGVLVGEVSSPPLGKLGGVKLVELTVHHVRIPLRKAVRHASYTRSDTDNLVVRCVLDDGTAGFGEGVPREYVTGETVES